jgi:translation initiation factor 1
MPLTVTIRRETKGRAGREVTTLSGLSPLGDAKIAALASELKRLCGAGGTVERGGVIVVQGDHRDRIEEALADRGWVVKRAGG